MQLDLFEPEGPKVIAVWFSCGAASAVAAMMTLKKYSQTHAVRILNNPVIEEGPDNVRFLKDCERWLGQTIETVSHPKWPTCSAHDVWEKERFMSGPAGAPCTRALKKRARQVWEQSNHVDWHVLGFTAEEQKRHDRFVLTERDNVLPVLIDAGITKQRCLQIIAEAGIRLPQAYYDGFNNANCMGCVKATSPTYWNLTREKYPAVFEARAELSRRLGVKLAKYQGRRVFLDELPADARGLPMSKLQMPDCGLFCEERIDMLPSDAVREVAQ